MERNTRFPLEGALDEFHCLEGKELSAFVSIIGFQAAGQFKAALLIGRKQRTTLHLDLTVKNGHHTLLRPELGAKNRFIFRARRICMALDAMTDQAKTEKIASTKMIPLPSTVALLQTGATHFRLRLAWQRIG